MRNQMAIVAAPITPATIPSRYSWKIPELSRSRVAETVRWVSVIIAPSLVKMETSSQDKAAPQVHPLAPLCENQTQEATSVLLSLSLCLSSDLLRFVLLDGYLQVVVLLAFSTEGTSLFQHLELLF